MDIFEIQKANPELFPQFSVKDIVFLYYNCPQREKILKLYSKYIQVNLTISGERIINFRGKKYLSKKNIGSFLKRSAYLQELPPLDPGWKGLVFYLKEDYLRRVFEEFKPHLDLTNLPEVTLDSILTFEINDQLRNCYSSFLPYFGQDQKLPEALLESKFKELLYIIFSHPDNKHILAYILSTVDGYEIPIWETMEINYMFDLKLEEFAELSNRSLSKFKRDFKDYYKTSPGKWLTEQRLTLAKSKLITSNKTIREIAFDCGFNNASHFSRVFKEQYAISPTHYRNRMTIK